MISVTIYNKQCDRWNGVQDVLSGSEFCAKSYFYTKSKKPLKIFKNLKTFSKKPRFFQPWSDSQAAQLSWPSDRTFNNYWTLTQHGTQWNKRRINMLCYLFTNMSCTGNQFHVRTMGRNGWWSFGIVNKWLHLLYALCETFTIRLLHIGLHLRPYSRYLLRRLNA